MWIMNEMLTVILYGIFSLASIANAGYCQQHSSCQATRYRMDINYHECGLFNWQRCSTHRQIQYTIYEDCYIPVCCPGYIGSSCSQALCHGSTTCANGGTCIIPNYCHCRPGFSNPHCSDINECLVNNGGCDQLCTNLHGSFSCHCRNGYTLDINGKSCTDINECLVNNGGCDHLCTNLHGSFSCHCRNGHTLDINGKSCTDINECRMNSSGCDHFCTNSNGSFSCHCKNGYNLELNGQSCTDINECLPNNGGCSQICTNFEGGYACQCRTGYSVGSDEKSCLDINECLLNNGGCSQTCTNFDGGYECQCNTGFSLGSNGKSCLDIDECESTHDCSQKCTNTMGSYICGCRLGYELSVDEKSCQDENECLIANGGCDDICINKDGSFHCQCHNGDLNKDDVSCKGNDTNTELTVFEIHKIHQQLLPRGCDFIELLSCQDQSKSKKIKLSSTSPWYRANTNSNILFTFGIVFLEIESLFLPVSLSGLEVFNSNNIIEWRFSSLQFTENDGIMLHNKHSDRCTSFPFTSKDKFQFIPSFLPTVYHKLQTILPEWIRFSRSGKEMLRVTDLKTDLVYGLRLHSVAECRGAPIQSERLYSVFRFDTNMTISLYGNEVHIPAPLNGNKFCLIVDICNDMAATVYLILPPESRNLFDRFDFFETLKNKYNIMLRPTGIGFSITNQINVRYKQNTNELQFWNGDTVTKYKLFESANLWLLTDVEWSYLNEKQGHKFVAVTSEIYFSVPQLSKLLFSSFDDVFDGLVQMRRPPTFSLTLKIFNSITLIDFVDIWSFEAYFSIGGKNDRSFCGDAAHPPGVFASFMISLNPFSHVPFIREWLYDLTGRVYAFIDTSLDDKTSINSNIVTDIISLKETIIQFNKTIHKMFDLIGNSRNTTGHLLLADLANNVNSLIQKIEDMIQLAGSDSFDVINVTDYVTEVWNVYARKFEYSCQEIINALEFEKKFMSSLKTFIQNEKYIIGQNINLLINKVRSQIFSISKSSGFGLKFSTFLKIVGLDFSLVDVELVYSNRLGQCSKYRKVSDLMKGEESVKILFRVTGSLHLGFFFFMESGTFLSVALSTSSQKFIGHFHGHVSILGMKVSADIFISNKILYLSLEGDIWNVFHAVISIEAEVGRQWHELSLNLFGKLTVGDDRKNFGGSYLDGLKLVAQQIAKEANERLTAVQEVLSFLQKDIPAVKASLTVAQTNFRKCNSAFDDAVRSMDIAKQKLEEAKGPYLAALRALEVAQKNVDNLCTIQACPDICVPGLRLTTCDYGWFKIPCLQFTNCMMSIPDFVCHTANVACSVIRGLAYGALETAKIFVRVPMLAFDLAKCLVSTAQLFVDKSRVVLVVAEGLLEVAKLGLDIVNEAIELTKNAIEGIKFILGSALHVFQLIITHGIQHIIDIKDCIFELQLSTADKSEFHVSCQVKAFGLPWHKIGFEFDFRNPIVSMWKIAKSTVTFLFDIVQDMLGKRKRRDISFHSMSRLHYILRFVKRNANSANFTRYLNDSIFPETNDVNEVELKSKFKDRIDYFKYHCNLFMNIYSFLKESVNHLIAMTNDSVNSMTEVSNFRQKIDEMKPNISSINFTAESLGINLEYAMNDYNLTKADLENAMKDLKQSLSKNSYLSALSDYTEFAKQIIDSQMEQSNNVSIIAYWLFSLNNLSTDYFNESQCVSLQDCILHSFSELYDLYSDESVVLHPISARNLTSELENDYQVLVLNKSRTITDSHRMAIRIKNNLQLLMKSNVFCSEAPVILNKLPNVTVLAESMVKFVCNTSGDPTPVVRWYQDNRLLNNDTGLTELTLLMVTEAQDGVYHCTAENLVTNVSSNEAILTVKICHPGEFFESEDCLPCELGFYQSQWNQQFCKACPVGFTTDKKGSQHVADCFEIDQSIVKIVTGAVTGISLVVAALLAVCKFKSVKQTKKRPSSDIRKQVFKEALVKKVPDDDNSKTIGSLTI